MIKIGIGTLFLLAVGLSMDAFAVSITNGLCYKNVNTVLAVKVGLAFGLAQGIMPVIGFAAGQTFRSAITGLDHWVALVLLGAIGGKMIVDAVSHLREPESCPVGGVLSMRILLLQAVATSIDALAVGVSFAVMNVNILLAASFIACVTFLFAVVGVGIGKKSGRFLKTKAEFAGGIILTLIGLKIFLEHMLG